MGATGSILVKNAKKAQSMVYLAWYTDQNLSSAVICCQQCHLIGIPREVYHAVRLFEPLRRPKPTGAPRMAIKHPAQACGRHMLLEYNLESIFFTYISRNLPAYG